MSLTSIAAIKEAAQMLDTAAVQWMNASPPDHIGAKIAQARELLQKGIELADAPLRIAIVGEFNSGKTLLLNSLLDTTDMFPCLLQPTTGNVLEVRVHLRKEERPPEIRKATVSFFNKYEIDNILEFYLKDLKNQSVDGLPDKITVRDLEKIERLLCKKFQEIRSITPKYAILSALEFIIALRSHEELVMREDRHSCPLPVDLIATSLTLTARPDLNKGMQAIYEKFKQLYAQKQEKPLVDKITSKNIRPLFPMIRRVLVDVNAWSVPFGLTNIQGSSTLAFLDFPGLGAESSSARDHYLCMTEISDAHSVLVLFNGSNPGGSGASVMATLFQHAGKLTGERTIVAVNRFDEFHPTPAGQTLESFYSKQEEGTIVGFCSILIPAKNLLSGVNKKFTLYICSALCYLFDEKTQRPNWNFGNPQWFNDSKRQAAYALYKRSDEDFQKIIHEVETKKPNPDHHYMKEGLERYLERGGIPSLRQDIVKFATEKGEKLILEDSLREVRSALCILDEIAPAAKVEEEGKGTVVSSELSYAAQEFYRVLELTAADTLPNGSSEYKKLKIRGVDKDVSLWEIIGEEISSNVTSWPEWFAILNQGTTKSARPPGKPQKEFSRYQKIKKQAGTVPTEFSAFNERFHNTAQTLTKQTLEYIGKSVLASLQRFEGHPDYIDALQHFQSMIVVDKLQNFEAALPLIDIWQPSQLAENEIIPMVLERIAEEVQALEQLSYPYDGSKPCFWNLALIIRIQVQLVKTYRDKLSRLVAAAESEFQNFFCSEMLRAEVLPLVRTVLNDPNFLGEVASTISMGEGPNAWEIIGQMVRSSVEKFKGMDSASGIGHTAKPKMTVKNIPPRPVTLTNSSTVAADTDLETKPEFNPEFNPEPESKPDFNPEPEPDLDQTTTAEPKQTLVSEAKPDVEFEDDVQFEEPTVDQGNASKDIIDSKKTPEIVEDNEFEEWK